MTSFAYFAVPVGLIVFFISEKWLTRMLIASTLFSGTAILNLGRGQDVSGVQAWIFFGVLFLARRSIGAISRGKLMLGFKIEQPWFYLAGFVLVAAGSLLMPLYIDGSLWIVSPVLLDSSATPLVFSTKNVTALLYLLFGSCLSVSVAGKVAETNSTDEFERIYLGTGAFVALWGIFQFFCSVSGLSFPSVIFNNNLSTNVAGPNSVLETIGIGRVSSVAVEPSILAQSLLTVLPLAFPAILGVGTVFSVRRDRFIAILIVAVLILTLSSLAYVGLLVFVLLSAMLCAYFGITRGRLILKYAGLCGTVIIAIALSLYLTNESAKDILNIVIFTKASGYSGLERLKTVTLAASYFAKYPWLGVGWGSVTSHDMLFKLLANVGLVGTLAFASLIVSIFRLTLKQKQSESRKLILTALVWTLSLAMLVIGCSLTEFSYVFGHFWLVLGLVVAAGSIRHRTSISVS